MMMMMMVKMMMNGCFHGDVSGRREAGWWRTVAESFPTCV